MCNVLVADDNPNIRYLLRTFIETQTELKVCGETGTGRDAVEKAAQLKPDIVILDLAMPELNGIEAASAIKRLLPDTRVVLFTMNVDGLGRRLAKALGIDFALCKEESVSKLAEYLNSIVPVASVQNTP